ncbi:MAG: DNA primase [Planctomycetia bacterium]|nr:DNA primase [Planctomycetia bacterium]
MPGAVINAGGDDAKERVREATDIVDLVGSYMVLRRAGKAMVGRCPWHDDSRPSLSVNPERQSFRCWVCDIGGDVFSFLMRMERIEFREALELLAQRAGIPLSRGSGQRDDLRAAVRAALEWSAGRFTACLRDAPEAEGARRYLTERGLTPATIERFGVGYAPAGWDWLLRQGPAAGHQADALEQAGLIVPRQDRSGHYDRFRDRVMFPIRDPQGRCIAFGGRALPGGPPDAAKYINSPETPLFSKSGTLYGLDTAREAITRSGRTVVVEGYMDCLAARQAGHGDVVAVLGTAVGERHARLLRRYAERIVLVLDGDAAGRRRADEVLDRLLAEPIDLRIARLPTGTDPCDLAMAGGHASLAAVIDAAIDPIDYRMDSTLERLGDRPADQAILAAVEAVLTPLARVSPRAPLSPAQRRIREDQVIGRLSRRFGLETAGLRRRLEELRLVSPREAFFDAPEEELAVAAPLDPLPAWDREVLELLLSHPDAAGFVAQLAPDDLDSPTARAVLAAAARSAAATGHVSLHGLLDELAAGPLHSLLVALDEDAADRPLPVTERLVHWEESRRRRTAHRLAQASVTALKSSTLDPGAEADLLERLVAHRRAVQGMTEPKEG